MLGGLAYLHARGIVHRDIKLDNLVFTLQSEETVIKLIDFGLATVIGGNQKASGAVGSLPFAAPEVLAENSKYDEKCDLWSAGVLLYTLVCGEYPFNVRDRQRCIKRIRTGKMKSKKMALLEKSVADVELKDLLLKLLEPSPAKRISA